MQKYSPAWSLVRRYQDDKLSPDCLDDLLPTSTDYALELSSSAKGSSTVWCGMSLTLTVDSDKHQVLDMKPYNKQLTMPFEMARYTHFRSMVPRHYFSGIIHGTMTRIHRYTTDVKDAHFQLLEMILLWKNRGYPQSLVDATVKRSYHQLYGKRLFLNHDELWQFD